MKHFRSIEELDAAAMIRLMDLSEHMAEVNARRAVDQALILRRRRAARLTPKV